MLRLASLYFSVILLLGLVIAPAYACSKADGCSGCMSEAALRLCESGGSGGKVTPTGDGNSVNFKGSAGNLISMLRGMVRLARITMMFVAALLGIICGVMWYTGQQQAQGMLQKFFVAVFFIFGATAILDAILGMTVGSVSATVEEKEGNIDSNWV